MMGRSAPANLHAGAARWNAPMIPLHDDNPTAIKPVATIGFIAACVAVFLWQVSLPPADLARFVYGFGFVPGVLFGDGALPRPTPSVPAISSIVTAMFVHGGWLHLLGNMLYLWIFGNNVEDSMGHGRFVVFYVLCGAAAAMAQAAQDPGSAIPMIGASGAIGGILGAYLLLYPRARVLVLIPLGFFTQLIRVRAVFVLGFWFVLQLLNSTASSAGAGGVAYWAHVGGFVAGAALIVVFRKPGFPLLARARAPSPPAGRKAPARRRRPWE